MLKELRNTGKIELSGCFQFPQLRIQRRISNSDAIQNTHNSRVELAKATYLGSESGMRTRLLLPF